MKSKNMFVLLAGLTLLSFVLAACGASAVTEEAPAEAAASFPTGKFIKSGTDDYGLIFNEDGTFTAFSGSYTMVRATYKVEGNVLTETSNNGGCETNVSFNYTFDGANLTFTYAGKPEDDACDGRRADFNNVTYVMSK